MLRAQDAYAQLIELEMNTVLAVAETIDPAKYYKQWREEKAHSLWLLGHIANTNNLLINKWCCEGSSLMPKEWREKFSPDFGGGVAPRPDADFYPSWDEVLESYKTVTEYCVATVPTLSDEVFVGPMRGGAPERIQERFKTVDNAIRIVTLHSAYHRGQMSMINFQD